MRLRERLIDDHEALVKIAEELPASDRYPPHVLAERPTAAFLTAPQELWSQVAIQGDGPVVGHVSLHEYTARSVMAVASEAIGLPSSDLAVVARLFVDPMARRHGAGRALLGAARAEAQRRGRTPILDVWVELDRAITLYESQGWRRVGEATIEFGSACTARCSHDGNSIRSYVYVDPEAGTG